MPNSNGKILDKLTRKSWPYLIVIAIILVILCVYDLRWTVPSIILMSILISIIVSIESISLGFKNTNKNRIINILTIRYNGASSIQNGSPTEKSRKT